MARNLRHQHILHNGGAPIRAEFPVTDESTSLVVDGLSGSESAVVQVFIDNVDPAFGSDGSWITLKQNGNNVNLTPGTNQRTISTPGYYRVFVETGGASNVVKVLTYTGAMGASQIETARSTVEDAAQFMTPLAPLVFDTIRAVLTLAASASEAVGVIGTLAAVSATATVLQCRNNLLRAYWSSNYNVSRIEVELDASASGAVRMVFNPGSIGRAVDALLGNGDMVILRPGQKIERDISPPLTWCYLIGQIGANSGTVYIRGMY